METNEVPASTLYNHRCRCEMDTSYHSASNKKSSHPRLTPPTQDESGAQQTEGSFAPGFNLPPDARHGPSSMIRTTKTTMNITIAASQDDRSTHREPPNPNHVTEDLLSYKTDSHAPSVTTTPRTRPAPNPLIVTNDGTHRVTIKWKLSNTKTCTI
jgi:hypothetical protein